MVLGVLGMLATVWPDLFNPSQSYSGSYLFGDLLAIIASAVYACQVVIIEKLFNEGVPPFAFVSHIAKYSVFLSLLVFCAMLQFNVYKKFTGNWLFLLYEIPLVIINFINMIVVVFFIDYFGATAYTIIALCGVLYSMLFDIFLFHSPFRFEVVIGYSVIIAAVVIFHLKEPKKPQDEHKQLMETNIDQATIPSTQRRFE